jgi:hypothetical protein
MIKRVVETRQKRYHMRTYQRNGKDVHDLGGVGAEIAKESALCGACAVNTVGK